MAQDFNQVTFTGRLGGPVEMRFTPGGSPVSNFTVASNRSWKDGEGEQKEETTWFNVVVWNKLAEICNQYLDKGSRVLITGRLQNRSWDDQATGEKKWKTEIVADNMIMLDSKPRDEHAGDTVQDQRRNSAATRSAQPQRQAPAQRKPVYDEDVEF